MSHSEYRYGRHNLFKFCFLKALETEGTKILSKSYKDLKSYKYLHWYLWFFIVVLYVSSELRFWMKNLVVLSTGDPISWIKIPFALLGGKFIYAEMFEKCICLYVGYFQLLLKKLGYVQSLTHIMSISIYMDTIASLCVWGFIWF